MLRNLNQSSVFILLSPAHANNQISTTRRKSDFKTDPKLDILDQIIRHCTCKSGFLYNLTVFPSTFRHGFVHHLPKKITKLDTSNMFIHDRFVFLIVIPVYGWIFKHSRLKERKKVEIKLVTLNYKLKYLSINLTKDWRVQL